MGISSILCGAPQSFILGHLLLLIFLNEMPMAVKCNLLSYVEYICLVTQSKNVKDIEKQLNEDFPNICDWIVDKKVQKQHSELFSREIVFLNIAQNTRQNTCVWVFFK